MTELAVREAVPVALPAPRLPVAGEVVPLPVVVPGEVVHRWPLTVPPWAIADPVEINNMRARIKYHRAPWWWRLAHSCPAEPTTLTPCPTWRP